MRHAISTPCDNLQDKYDRINIQYNKSIGHEALTPSPSSRDQRARRSVLAKNIVSWDLFVRLSPIEQPLVNVVSGGAVIHIDVEEVNPSRPTHRDMVEEVKHSGPSHDAVPREHHAQVVPLRVIEHPVILVRQHDHSNPMQCAGTQVWSWSDLSKAQRPLQGTLVFH